MDVIPPNMDILIGYSKFPPNMDVIQENEGWWDILIHLSGASIFSSLKWTGKRHAKQLLIRPSAFPTGLRLI